MFEEARIGAWHWSGFHSGHSSFLIWSFISFLHYVKAKIRLREVSSKRALFVVVMTVTLQRGVATCLTDRSLQEPNICGVATVYV